MKTSMGASPRTEPRPRELHWPDVDPIILICLESRRSRLLVAALTLAVAAWMAAMIFKPAVADYLARRATSVAQLERAIAWDPDNPSLQMRAGDAYETMPRGADVEKARYHFESALRLRPSDALVWLRLALLADRQNDIDRAHQMLDTALRLDPHNVTLRWEAGLLAFRWGERERALDHLRYVLAVDPSQREAAFQLARVLLEPGEDPASLLPQEPDGLTNVLFAAIDHSDVPLAKVAWARRVALRPVMPEPIGRSYLNLLLKEGDGAAARRAWLTLVPDGNPASQGSAVWNGGFEADRLLGWGFDWRVQRVWGVEVSIDRFVAAKGSRSLRLTFNSFPTLDFAGVSQLVAVEPGREYRLRALAKALDFTTRSGLKLQVVLPKDEKVLAETKTIAETTADWVPLETRVRIPAETSLVLVRVRRAPSPAPEGNLGGKVWVDEVSLQ